ncbi:MAG: hypothetical protein ACLTTW_01545 [Coprobacter sp.]
MQAVVCTETVYFGSMGHLNQMDNGQAMFFGGQAPMGADVDVTEHGWQPVFSRKNDSFLRK